MNSGVAIFFEEKLVIDTYIRRVAGPLVADHLTLETKMVVSVFLLILCVRIHYNMYFIACVLCVYELCANVQIDILVIIIAKNGKYTISTLYICISLHAF